MINSLNKGKRFEREVAKILTKHFGVPFKRVPMSGAFSTTQNTKNPVFAGDVFTEDKWFNDYYNIVIECKRIKRLSKKQPDATMKDWLKQCSRESHKKNFWLIYKEDRKPIMIIRGYYKKWWGHYVMESMLLTEWLKHKKVRE